MNALANQVLSPRQLAEAVGVSESSIKRWADDGTVRVIRTAGGHRRIPLDEALRFVRGSQLKLVRPELLGLPEAVAGADAESGEDASDEERLFGHLSTGRGRAARGLVLSLYLDGASAAQVIDGPLRGALARIGELWRDSEAGIFVEHRATDLAIEALHQLRGLLPAPPEGAPRAVGGALAGDPYILPSLAVATVLKEGGFEAANLGPDTPVAALLEAVESLAPRLVWVSVGVAGDAAGRRREVERLLAAVAESGGTLAVGGREHGRLGLAEHPRLLLGSSLAELSAFVRGLGASVTG